MAQIHILYNGQTEDLDINDLFPLHRREEFGLSNESLSFSDVTSEQIKRALASHYDKPIDEFNELVVEFHKNGNVTVRPDAVFGY